MKIITVLLFLCFSLLSFAEDRAVVLISLKGKSGLLRKDVAQKVLKQFKQSYNHSLPLTVIQNATQEDLYRETHNPENKALFWISHANSFGAEVGLGQEDMILDSEGTNVKDLLQHVHPNLNLLAVLGCNALPILKKNHYGADLTIVSFDKKISSKKAISESLKVLDEVKFVPGNCQSEQGIRLTIKRTFNNAKQAVSIKVMNRGKVIGFFPKPVNQAQQTLTVYLSEAKIANDMKLIFDSGKIDNQKNYELGIFEIQFQNQGVWSLFRDKSGSPMGITQNIYRYKGEAGIQTEVFEPYHCR